VDRALAQHPIPNTQHPTPQPMTLAVLSSGDPVLRSPAVDIDRPIDPQLELLITDLVATAEAKNGVGIAAPQVGISRRLFIVASRPTPRYPAAPTMAPTAIINPRILDRSTEMISGWEGCLSVPDCRGLVLRHQSIEVEYTNKYGDLVQQQLTDFVARIFQHELDHLDGILFPDRVLNPADLITEAAYQKIAFDL
jgi:peptide deformylase